MVRNKSFGSRLFDAGNHLFLLVLALVCLLPMLNVLAVSFSKNAPAEAGLVWFWPVDFTTKSYAYALSQHEFLNSLGITLQRVGFGVVLIMFVTIITAYPLSKESIRFKSRTVYVWIFVFTMLFNGGLIPGYLVVKETGLLNTIWALIVPDLVAVFNIVLLLNFFRGIPKELEEAATMDGAGAWTTLWRVYVPLSTPALATLTLFVAVSQWNQWFDGMIYMKTPDRYPLSTYLQTVVIKTDADLASVVDADLLEQISGRTTRAAQVFLGAAPILLLYPFLQKYFVKGIVLGSVKE